MNDAHDHKGMSFLKMHGAGNDFVILDFRGRADVVGPALARAVGDRHRGVGFDQLAEVRDDGDADFYLGFWNADGSRAEACGNASRCVADVILRESGQEVLRFRTDRGLLSARRRADGLVEVNMGQPQLDWRDIPLAQRADPLHLPLPGDPAGIGMGNPHCVMFVEDAGVVDPAKSGPQLEKDPLFPKGTNVEFASLAGPDRLRIRVWERGAGVTQACGSGACATAVAAHLRGMTGRRVTLVLDGGQIEVDWRDDGVWMAGPTATVFAGCLTPEFLARAR